MAWFGLLQSRRDVAVRAPGVGVNMREDGRRDAGSPTGWEVLNQAESAAADGVGMSSAETNEVEVGSGSEDEDETLSVVEGEDDMKNQIEALRRELVLSQQECVSLGERMRRDEGALDALKESSNEITARLRSELDEARRGVEKSRSEVDRAERELAKLKDVAKAAADESHQTQVRARLEIKGTRLLLEEKSKQASRSERDNERLKGEVKAAKDQIDQLVPETKSLGEDLARTQEQNDELAEISRSLKKEAQILRNECRRTVDQNSQLLAMMGVRSLEQGEHAFATKQDLVSDQEVVKMLEELNSEIFEASAYMADSFTFPRDLEMSDEVREARVRATQMLGPTMVLNLTSVRHDEDPLIVQIACQACMVECCRRIIASWCVDGSIAEEFLPELYGRFRQTGEPWAFSGSFYCG